MMAKLKKYFFNGLGVIGLLAPTQLMAAPEIVQIWLVNAATNTRIQPLEDFQSLLLPALPTQLSIEVEVNSETESVNMVLGSAITTTESKVPYALGGDNAGDFNPVPELRKKGWVTLSVQPFSENYAGGSAGAMVSRTIFRDQTDFVVTNANDMGDYNPGDGFCSTTKPVTLTDNIWATLPNYAGFQETKTLRYTAVKDITVKDVSLDAFGDFFDDYTAVPILGKGCTLRAAIEEANALAGQQSIFIDGAKGPYKLIQGELLVTDGLSIKGHGLPVIDADKKSRVFHIDGQGKDIIVNMSKLDMVRGYSPDRGGVLRVTGDALLQLSDSIVREGQGNYGGGIYLQDGGDLTLRRSSIRDNTAGNPDTFGGGGITQRGGGIYSLEGIVKIYDSAIFDNRAVRGGGLSNKGGTMRIENSSIVDNEAVSIGGGIENHDNGNETGNLHLSFVTVAHNQAGTAGSAPVDQRSGGGLYNTGSVYMANSIMAENTDAWFDGFEHHAPDCYSNTVYDFLSFRRNIVGVLNSNCIFTDYSYGNHAWIDFGSEAAPLDPGLSGRQLSNHKAYYPLSYGSIAVDGGATAAASLYPCADHDMLGDPRPQGGACDIGAIETY